MIVGEWDKEGLTNMLMFPRKVNAIFFWKLFILTKLLKKFF